MNRKILVVSILAVFTLVAISFASAINTTTPVKKKETPLYKIRIRRAIGERLGKIIDYIKTKFLGDRIFFLPFQWLRKQEETSDIFSIIFCLTFKTCSTCMEQTRMCPTCDGPC